MAGDKGDRKMRIIEEFRTSAINEVNRLLNYDAEMRQYLGEAPKSIHTLDLLSNMEAYCAFMSSVERNDFHGFRRFTAKASAKQRKACVIEEFKKLLDNIHVSGKEDIIKELEIALERVNLVLTQNETRI
jgi:hypothetical protein